MVKWSPLTSSSISSLLCCGHTSQTSSPSPGCGFCSSPFSPCPDGLPLHAHCGGSERTATTRHDALWRQARELTESNKQNSLSLSTNALHTVNRRLTGTAAAVPSGTPLARWGRRPLFDLPLLSSIQEGSCLGHVLLAAITHAHTERAKSRRQGKNLAKLVHHG